MSTKSYAPHPESTANKALEFLKANFGQEKRASEIAAYAGVSVRRISSALKYAIAAGGVTKQFRDGHSYYRLEEESTFAPRTDFGIPVQTVPPKKNSFTAALYSDGKLQIIGARSVAGGVVLDPEQAAELREYLLHTGSLIEAIQKAAKALPT